MPEFYVYLIASLPMLSLESKPPFSFAKFLDICRGLVPDEAMKILESLSLEPDVRAGLARQETVRKWLAFDTELRNELAKIRGHRKKIDASKYLREGGSGEPSIAHMASNAARNPSVLEAERMLDRDRWYFLGELAAGHYFDLYYLITYAYKLLLVERWHNIRMADKSVLLKETLAKA